MHEITVLSGKGGTGKTSITAALASLANNAVLCDTDVDAADLHLILNPTIREEHDFEGSWVANVNNDDCSLCGSCVDVCRYDAIHGLYEGQLSINPFSCEGCRLCERICPDNAITSTKNSNNYWYVSDTRFGNLVHAKMAAGEENSGKLVTKVREAAKALAKDDNRDILLNDGPPGIGCPVISALTGTNTVLMVVEPSKSGLHDANRLFELIGSFNLKVFGLINKYDINIETSTEIEQWMTQNNIPLLAKIPFDTNMVEAMVNQQTIVEYSPQSDISLRLKSVWNALATSEEKIQ